MHALDRAWAALQADFDAGCSAHARDARRRSTSELNQLFRRLRQYETEGQWLSLVCEAAATFAEQTALFSLEKEELVYREGVNVDLGTGTRLRLPDAPGFAAAVTSREPVVVLRRRSEVGEALASENISDRAHLYPITNGDRVVALLYAGTGENTDTQGLELIAQMASALLERRGNQSLHMQIAPLPSPVTAAQKSDEEKQRPPWSALEGKDQELHRRAQRFARLAVARIQVARPEACRAGRKGADLYTYLQSEIDRTRDAFRSQFMTIPSMVDYLHLELVDQIANGDAGSLGVEYPGPLG